MIITLHKPSTYHTVKEPKYVEVQIHKGEEDLRDRYVGDVIETAHIYKVTHGSFRRIYFENSSKTNLGTILLNGPGKSKARKKTMGLLRRIGIEGISIQIHEKKTLENTINPIFMSEKEYKS